jgi:hypothetical protein
LYFTREKRESLVLNLMVYNLYIGNYTEIRLVKS